MFEKSFANSVQAVHKNIFNTRNMKFSYFIHRVINRKIGGYQQVINNILKENVNK